MNKIDKIFIIFSFSNINLTKEALLILFMSEIYLLNSKKIHYNNFLKENNNNIWANFTEHDIWRKMEKMEKNGENGENKSNLKM